MTPQDKRSNQAHRAIVLGRSGDRLSLPTSESIMSKIKLKKYEQAIAILPRCKTLDRLVLYDNLKKMGYRWSVSDRRWCVEPFNGLPAEGHGFLPGTADDYFSKPRNCALRPGERVVEFGSVVIKPIEVQVQELIAQAVETPSGAEIDSVQEPIAPSVETPSGVETDSVQEAIAPAVETSSGVETDLVSEAIAQAAKTSPGVEVNQIQETIAQVVETSLGVEVDQVQEGIEFFTVSPRRSFESFDDSMSFLEVLQLCRDVEKTLESKSLGELQRLVSKIVKVKPGCHCLSVAGKKKHRSTWVRSAKLELSNLVQMRGFAKTPRGLGGLEPILCWEILWESEDLIIRDYDALILLVQEAIAQVVETSPVVEVDQVSEAIVQVAETSPGLQVEQVQQAIEVQVQEPIESKFGRIVYPKAAAEPIAPAAKNLTPGGINETRPNIDRTGSADLHQRCLHSTQPDGNNSGIETETLGSRKGDRVLAVSGDSQADRRRLLPNQSNELTATIFTDEQPSNRGDGRGRVESEVKVNQSAISPDVKISVGVEADRPQKSKFSIAHQLLDLFKSSVACSQDSIELAAKTPPGVETDYLLEPIEIPPGVTFSPRFLSLYSPPQSENISYKADADGQLSLLDFEVQSESEFPDPDDFESLDDFRQAIALWDIEHPESLEVSLDSFTYQADYELAESSEVMEFSSAILAEGCVNESSSTYNFSIPTFDAWCDRTSRNSSDEPPTAGVGARRPKPKPPSFPPMVVAAGDRANRIKKFARSATLAGGRAPPGGDATQM
ncbi:hypothetical protein [Microcoleus anatoxicus]|uniref:Uncharacterized protein n=1 Tax=Microcoleus anatoxicus PTRS2 TaxID=2705321 RepID=A0ABU8YM47_9CYAN